MDRALGTVLAVMLAGCSAQLTRERDGGVSAGDSRRPASEAGAGADSAPPTTDCTGAPDFTPCSTGTGVESGTCLDGRCVALEPCPSSGCKPGPSFPLPDTNLRVCHDAAGAVPCPGQAGDPACAGTAYCGQDAQLGWDTKHPGTARFAVSKESEPVVSDSVTGLAWQGCSAGQSGTSCQGNASLMDWYAADAHCEQSSWGGFSDWRLPDSFELQSIADYGRTSPAIDLSVFVNAPSHDKVDQTQWWKECYWSATSYASDASLAWAMISNNGDIAEGSGHPYHPNDKAAKGWEGCYVRCVRLGGPLQRRRLVRYEPVAGEPMVADVSTRLQWQGCSAGQTGAGCAGTAAMLDWKSALARCEGLTWGGHDDWRLPNVKELRSIVDLTRTRPAVDTALFPNPPVYVHGTSSNTVGQYWSSTGRSYNSFALYVSFDTGFSHFYKQSEGRHVRCVRGSGY
jgi:hypothetical protein